MENTKRKGKGHDEKHVPIKEAARDIAVLNANNKHTTDKLAKGLAILLSLSLSLPISAQRGTTTRAKLLFPTEKETQKQDITWEKTLYKEVSVYDKENADLAEIVTDDRQSSLFQVIIEAVTQGMPAYEYAIVGNERFTPARKADIRSIFKDYQIPFSAKNGVLAVKEEDIPSEEVTLFLVKEKQYYDNTNGSFHTRTDALCPVIVREDEFGDGTTRYPLFWVKMDDLKEELSHYTMAQSTQNRAKTLCVADFFTLTAYKGTPYKQGNAMGLTVAHLTENDSVAHHIRQTMVTHIHEVKKKTYGEKSGLSVDQNHPARMMERTDMTTGEETKWKRSK